MISFKHIKDLLRAQADECLAQGRFKEASETKKLLKTNRNRAKFTTTKRAAYT